MSRHPGVTSKVKLLILDLLSSKKWVKSSILLKKTKQKYFDRRIRELRDELGYDIETGFKDGESAYKLRSNRRGPTKKRTYLNKSEKQSVLAAGDQCSLCSVKFNKNTPPTLDHRIPLIRGGSGNKTNFQTLCVECNNQKRSQCRGCKLDCKHCFLAFPESLPKGEIIRPRDRALWLRFIAISKERKLEPEELILRLIEDEVNKRKSG